MTHWLAYFLHHNRGSNDYDSGGVILCINVALENSESRDSEQVVLAVTLVSNGCDCWPAAPRRQSVDTEKGKQGICRHTACGTSSPCWA